MLKTILTLAALLFAVPSRADNVDVGITVKVVASEQATLANSVSETWSAPHWCFRNMSIVHADGSVDPIPDSCNTVVTQGKNHLLDTYFKGSAYTAAWYLIPKGSGTINATDTYATHAGWTEITAYSAGTRPAITWGTTSAGSNTATQVSYAINGTATIAGVCILMGSSTKSDVTNDAAHNLYSCSDFAGARSVLSGDTLNVTPTVTD